MKAEPYICEGNGISLAWWARWCGKDAWDRYVWERIERWVNTGFQTYHDYNKHVEWSTDDEEIE